jgi:hypothetical protein
MIPIKEHILENLRPAVDLLDAQGTHIRNRYLLTYFSAVPTFSRQKPPEILFSGK